MAQANESGHAQHADSGRGEEEHDSALIRSTHEADGAHLDQAESDG